MTWSVELLCDGDPVVGLPVDDWLAAEVLALASVALWGGPVSVLDAVAAQRRAEQPERTIFDALGDVA